MSAELEVLQDIAGRFERAGIAYMLTGSVALSYYAEPRMTRDIDLVVELGGRDSAQLAGMFAPDYYVSEADVGQALRQHGMFNVLHLRKVVKIDLIVRKDDEYRKNEFSRRQKVRLGGLDAWIVSKEDLILSKLAWAKPSMSQLQLGDVRKLLATGADTAYLRRWAPGLSVAELLEATLDGRHDT